MSHSHIVFLEYRHCRTRRIVSQCQSYVGRCFGNCEEELPEKLFGRLSRRLTVGRQLDERQPTGFAINTDYQPVACWEPIGNLSAESQPTVSRQVFQGALLHSYPCFSLTCYRGMRIWACIDINKWAGAHGTVNIPGIKTTLSKYCCLLVCYLMIDFKKKQIYYLVHGGTQ